MPNTSVQLMKFCDVYQFQVLPIEEFSIDILERIPFSHKDPFDRLLIATCLSKDLTLISSDGSMKGYVESNGLKLLS